MQTQEDHSNLIPALNVDSLKVDLVVIQNTCSDIEDSNSETVQIQANSQDSRDHNTSENRHYYLHAGVNVKKYVVWMRRTSFQMTEIEYIRTDSTVQDDREAGSGNDCK
ncbi:hypothetical protein Tco_0655504 [Tanacetum coccineum]|uniref:Uncharacterized protein n=1 Tax=Tanacetum coccineum TaxID=301880 RepID=A0ABQ4X669_9ASTR